jgi:hypothetical protein
VTIQTHSCSSFNFLSLLFSCHFSKIVTAIAGITKKEINTDEIKTIETVIGM